MAIVDSRNKRDKSQRFISLREGVERIASASSRPIYTYHSQVLQYGTIGGKVLGGIQHGRQAAEITQRILDGESPASIPIIDKSLAQYHFDYLQLQRFGIDTSRLPEESVIIDRPYSFYGEYKTVVWATVLGTVLLILIIVFLQLNILKRKQIESSLRSSEAELQGREEHIRLLLNSTAEAIYGLDLEGCCSFCNPASLRLLGYEQEADLLGKNMHDLSHHTRTDGAAYPEPKCKICQAFRVKQGAHIDDELLWGKDGSSFWAECWSHPVRKDGETVGGVVTFIDITERKKAELELIKHRDHLDELVPEFNL